MQNICITFFEGRVLRSIRHFKTKDNPEGNTFYCFIAASVFLHFVFLGILSHINVAAKERVKQAIIRVYPARIIIEKNNNKEKLKKISQNDKIKPDNKTSPKTEKKLTVSTVIKSPEESRVKKASKPRKLKKVVTGKKEFPSLKEKQLYPVAEDVKKPADFKTNSRQETEKSFPDKQKPVAGLRQEKLKNRDVYVNLDKNNRSGKKFKTHKNNQMRNLKLFFSKPQQEVDHSQDIAAGEFNLVDSDSKNGKDGSLSSGITTAYSDHAADRVQQENPPKTELFNPSNNLKNRAEKLNNFKKMVAWKIESVKRYPVKARMEGMEGKVTVAFTIDTAGNVKDPVITRKSGFPELDTEAIESLKRAQPFLPFPEDIKTSVRVKIKINFKLGKK